MRHRRHAGIAAPFVRADFGKVQALRQLRVDKADCRIRVAAALFDPLFGQRAHLRLALGGNPPRRFVFVGHKGIARHLIKVALQLQLVVHSWLERGIGGHAARRNGRADAADAPQSPPETALRLQTAVKLGVELRDALPRGCGGAGKVVVRCPAAARQTVIGRLRLRDFAADLPLAADARQGIGPLLAGEPLLRLAGALQTALRFAHQVARAVVASGQRQG